MIELVGGALIVVGGGMLSASSWTLARAGLSAPSIARELLAALPFTPFPRPDAALDALIRDADAALSRD